MINYFIKNGKWRSSDRYKSEVFFQEEVQMKKDKERD